MQEIGHEEELILRLLDESFTQKAIRSILDRVATRVEQKLQGDRAAVMAWEPVPLEIYGRSMPDAIQSSWVFILRAEVATGAERHPNSRQRMISYRGSGDLQTRTAGPWESHRLVSTADAPLQERWISIPENVWHQAIASGQNWVVVSFHTVPAEELIEERLEASGLTRQRTYLQMR